MPDDLDKLGDKLSSIKLQPPHPSSQKKPPPKPSSIFITKKFNSLSHKKPLAPANNPKSPSKKTAFDKNAFFDDKPMAPNDPRWGKKVHLYRSDQTVKPVVIENPMNTNLKLDPKADVKVVSKGSGFSKFSRQDSPFKDPYSALNNSSERSGKAFLDEKASFYQDETKVAESLVQSITEIDEAKEIEKLKTEPIDDNERKVSGLGVNLLDHQVLGLRFLLRREDSELKHKGGLLCDDMGLGKTVQAIALIVKNGPSSKSLKDLSDIEEHPRISHKFKGTLVIGPVSLGMQWAQEIKRFAPHLKTLVFHGPSRTTDPAELAKYDVVISSYDTIRSEHKKSASSPIYKGLWHRIILDEAHVIKNIKAQQAIAVTAIESSRRWCLTGTPLQNSIDDLQSLFRFLKVSQLSFEKYWRDKITYTMKKGRSYEAFENLKKELEIVMLRRTKAILDSTNFTLPAKRIHSVGVQFTAFEQTLYDNLKSESVSRLSALEPSETNDENSIPELNKLGNGETNDAQIKLPHESFYMKALLALLRLRQTCCHFKLLADSSTRALSQEAISSVTTPKSASSDTKSNDIDVDDLADFMTSLTVAETKCEICFNERVSKGERVCSSCSAKINDMKQTESAKVLKLIEILTKDRSRKTIIFSQFREMLLLLGKILSTLGFRYVMYDGKMNIQQKDQALEKLRNDKDTTILLCSLKSGAVGLNLTVASQVVLYDPWWNPQIEEQAIDRVYRIGQTKEVDVYKLFVEDTVEVGIIELQERKRNLAKAVTDGDSNSIKKMSSLTSKDLKHLFGI